jgi:hypothetical protein
LRRVVGLGAVLGMASVRRAFLWDEALADQIQKTFKVQRFAAELHIIEPSRDHIRRMTRRKEKRNFLRNKEISNSVGQFSTETYVRHGKIDMRICFDQRNGVLAGADRPDARGSRFLELGAYFKRLQEFILDDKYPLVSKIVAQGRLPGGARYIPVDFLLAVRPLATTNVAKLSPVRTGSREAEVAPETGLSGTVDNMG